MQHEIPLEKLGPQGKLMADPIGACVHCGFCLPTCPTYVVLGEEMDSPRGRIYLMKQMLEGELPLAGPQLDNLDACLGCQACVTACPSGVEYGDLLTAFRAHLEEDRKRPPLLRLLRTVLRETLPYPRRFRLALKLGRAGRPFQRLLPSPLRPLVDMLPEHVPPAAPLPAFTPAQGQRRARVALLAGCVQQVLSPRINQATLSVLSRNGVEVLVPPAQGCCGALALHMGEAPKARALAERNLRAFNPKDVDAIVTNAAGCGSGMKEYAHLFAGLDNEEGAKALAAKVVDVSAFLEQIGIAAPGPLPRPARIAYHD
ncbi:MAG TPA: heterodisulfide reductase-related iron-sulfur binding cluster, partial [Limnochordia bacterium]|nr:heterodisulfide reductase-related iron-sulfur binding cluster [Limnochordia bacterium]